MRIALSARAAFPPTTADSKPSPKNSPRGWRRAATGHGLLPRAASRTPSIAACACSTCPPSATNTSTPSRTPSSPPCICCAHRADVALYCNGANAIFTPAPRLFGMPVALNVDGIERKRKKWNRAGQGLVSGVGVAGHVLPDVVVTDARTIQEYYRERYGKQSVFIPYGAEIGQGGQRATRSTSWAWSRGRYFLYVSRMEPENHPLEVRRGVRAGGHADEAGADRRRPLRATSTSRACAIRATRASSCPGAIYGDGLSRTAARTASPTSTPPRWAARIPR